MVQTIVDLGNREERFLNVYKAQKGIKSKNAALNEILRDYEDIIKKQQEDIIFENRVKEAIDEYEKSPNKKNLNKKDFLEEISKW